MTVPSRPRRKPVYLVLKRTADILLSGLAILVLSPVLLLTALVLLLTGEHLVI